LGRDLHDPLLTGGQLARVAGAATAHAGQLVLRALGPDPGADRSEHRLRFGEGCARVAALPSAAFDDALREERAGVLERHVESSVLSEGRFENLDGTGEITVRGEHEPATPRPDRESPGPVELTPATFEA